MAQVTGLPRPLFWPVIQIGFAYARLRRDINLREASPERVLRATATPVLLIHGTRDRNIPIRHSRELHAANPRETRLWEVPEAGHVGALAAEGDIYIRTVTEWFRTH
jgi:pimeloyl-ACP methyl ester carboxylesterase